MARVRLREIVSSGDRAAVMGLRRGPGRDQYLDSMGEIFAEADEEQRAVPHAWAVHDAETGALVGFTMISDDIPQPMDDDLVGPYYLWKLLIDHPFRHHGYSTETLDALVDYLATRPGADVLYTSWAGGPGSPPGSTSGMASPTPAGSCGAKTSSRWTWRCEAHWGLPDHLHQRGRGHITHICASQFAEYERTRLGPDMRCGSLCASSPRARLSQLVRAAARGRCQRLCQ